MLDSFFYQISFTENSLFLLFSFILIFSAISIITVQNPIYSVLFLVLNFLTASGLLFLLECEFLALLFIIIYVGAIAVLFLFVIMMLDLKILSSSKDIFKYLPAGSFIGGAFFLVVTIIILDEFYLNSYLNCSLGLEFVNFYINWYSNIDSFTDIQVIGQLLYTHYVIQFLISGIILLLAVLGAVSLTMNNESQQIKKQMFFKQISRNHKNILLF